MGRGPIAHIGHERILDVQKRVLLWYERHGRRFPWRKRRASHYHLVVGEILLQRTRAETVASVFPTFFDRFPSWRILAQATEEQIADTIRPIGLWRRRSVSLAALARIMAGRNGEFPRLRSDVEQLPGVGQYVASAVLLFCHNDPQPLLDVNMARVLERVFGPRRLADIRYDPYLLALSKAIVMSPRAREVNWAILDLGGSICGVRSPQCGLCPLRTLCAFGGRELQNTYPPEDTQRRTV